MLGSSGDSFQDQGMDEVILIRHRLTADSRILEHLSVMERNTKSIPWYSDKLSYGLDHTDQYLSLLIIVENEKWQRQTLQRASGF